MREALKMGYSLVDTASAYVNERAVGRSMKASGVQQEDVFLSTKLWPSAYENPNAVDETLARLGVDYVDLLYIHQPAGNWLAGYRQLEKAYKAGKAKAIGMRLLAARFTPTCVGTICTGKPATAGTTVHPHMRGDNGIRR